MDWIPCMSSQNQCAKSFLVTGINNNLKGAKDHVIPSVTDIQMIFNDENDDEVFTATATANINKLLIK